MTQDAAEALDHTAERVALWRALHVEVDAPPHVLEDELGLRLAEPAADWRQRPDMEPESTSGFRAAIVARARYLEDLVADAVDRGVEQYVILGSGLDTFAQRRPELAGRLRIFEVDQPGTVAFKRRRLDALGYGVPAHQRLVPVDFDAGEPWPRQLAESGFDPTLRSVIVSTGVAMYLSQEATQATLRDVAGFAPGTTLAMTFLLPPELVDEADRAGLRRSAEGARSSGTPFRSFYTPTQMLELARAAGFTDAQHVPGSELAARYFEGRSDGLRPSSGEDFLLATA